MAHATRSTLRQTADGIPVPSSPVAALPVLPLAGKPKEKKPTEPERRSERKRRKPKAIGVHPVRERPIRRSARVAGAGISAEGFHQAEDFFNTLLKTSTSPAVAESREASPSLTSSTTWSPRREAIPLRESVSSATRRSFSGASESAVAKLSVSVRPGLDNVRAYVNSTTPGRVFFVTKGVPFCVNSIIKFQKDKEKKKAEANQQVELDNIIAPAIPKQGVSYAQALELDWAARPSDDPASASLQAPVAYDPLFVDNPGLTTGKHRTVMNLPGYKASIIPFVKSSDLKAELNRQFRNKHPNLSPDLTLSKIRNLKRVMLEVSLEQDLDLSTVAMAYVYFEKLVLKSVVTKANRRLLAAVCLNLAFKFNDMRTLEKDGLRRFTEATAKTFSVQTKDIFGSELAVCGYLNFSLNAPEEEVRPHYTRLAREVALGEEMTDEPGPAPLQGSA